MYRLKEGPRFEYREQEQKRVNDSPTLADKFPQLKSLTVDLGYYGSDGVGRNSQIKFMPNLETARAVFRFDCPNDGCIGGDFDLSKELAEAVAHRRTHATGEISCQGWQSKTTINSVRCHNVLRYTLKLSY